MVVGSFDISMSLTTVDLISLGILIFFFVLGLFKGFTYLIIRLATFLIGLAVAKQYAGSADEHGVTGFAATLVEWFDQLKGNEQVAVYIAFFLIFLGIFILGTLIAFLLRAVFKKLQLGAYDRILGGALGVVTGAVCIVIVVSGIVFFSPDSEIAASLGGSHTVQLSTKVIEFSKPFFPEALAEKMNQIIENIPKTSSPAIEGG